MMGGVWGIRKSIHQSWLARGLGLLCWRFRKRFLGPVLFKKGQWHFQQDNAPVHNSILVTDYLTKTVRQPPNCPDLPPWDFWLFPKLSLSLCDNGGDERGCDEGHWYAHTSRLLCSLPEVVGGDYFEGD